jgi:hypothetical protein
VWLLQLLLLLLLVMALQLMFLLLLIWALRLMMAWWRKGDHMELICIHQEPALLNLQPNKHEYNTMVCTPGAAK